MEVLDYNSLRDRLAECLTAAGMRISVEEAVFLSSMTRACDIYVYPPTDGPDVWGKVSFEWGPENQSLLEELDHQSEYGAPEFEYDDVAAQISLHGEFHLHFGRLAVTTDSVSDVAGNIKRQAEEYFGDDGGVVAEVVLTSEQAKLDCLRYEVNTSAPMVTDESWWERWGDIYRAMLTHMSVLYMRLESMFGPQRN